MADNKSRGAANETETASAETTESNDSVGEARPESSDLATGVARPLPTPQFGPGSKVNWDNDKTDPNKRKHIGIDPEGTHNAKLFG